MRLRNHLLALLAVFVAIVIVGSCSLFNSGNDEARGQRYYVNQFAHSMMSTYYLWNSEIKSDLGKWKYSDDPIQKVRDIRYKDYDGSDIDKWSMVTDDYESFNSQVTGNTKSMGFEFQLYYADQERKNVLAVVTFTYAGGPAEKAGLHRGDVIIAINGSLMTPQNYVDVLSSSVYGDGTAYFTLSDEREVKLTSRHMYLNPVGCHRVIEKEGRKIGYLHFSSFTLDACNDLVGVFKEFKLAGITDLVLDLRYNGGGYMTTSEVLASLIVPQDEISKESIFLQDIYNSILSDAWGVEQSKFASSFELEDSSGKHTISIADAKPDIVKMYAIMTGGTASASESTVCGLLPYMPVCIAGSQSAGKYCGGFIVDGPTWYEWVKDELTASAYKNGVSNTKNWGIYLMVSRYADVHGNTPCMPDGFLPDIAVDDDPLDGYELGDPEETMLAAILGNKNGKARNMQSPARTFIKMDVQPQKPQLAILKSGGIDVNYETFPGMRAPVGFEQGL